MAGTPTFAPDYQPAYHPCGAPVGYARRFPQPGDLIDMQAADFQLPDGRWPCAGDMVPACDRCGIPITVGIGPEQE